MTDLVRTHAGSCDYCDAQGSARTPLAESDGARICPSCIDLSIALLEDIRSEPAATTAERSSSDRSALVRTMQEAGVAPQVIEAIRGTMSAEDLRAMVNEWICSFCGIRPMMRPGPVPSTLRHVFICEHCLRDARALLAPRP